MKYVDEFRDPTLAKSLIEQINALAQQIESTAKRPLRIMEFCGGHTHAIFRFGLEQLLPKFIELVHGPGCPVCVLPAGKVDDCVSLAQNSNVIFTTFGDAMRVPGSKISLLQAKANGADVRMVYSPLDALQLAHKHKDREVIFFALGFETTMPSTALTVLQADDDELSNFSIFCNHITTVPILNSILETSSLEIDGFVAPGHVSMVIGEKPFHFVSEKYKKPIVISGFEPLDILQSIWLLLKQIVENRAVTENQYSRVVKSDGNTPGMEAMNRVFELRESFDWRGLGAIDHSGVRIKKEYARFDAEQKFAVTNFKVADPEACQCGEVLIGKIKPWQCKVFGTDCTPETPMGALMVSAEGACAAYYNFGNRSELMALKLDLEKSLS